MSAQQNRPYIAQPVSSPREITVRPSEYTPGSFDVVVHHNAEQFTVVPLTVNELYNLRALLIDMPLLPPLLPEVPWSDDDDKFNDTVSDRMTGRDRQDRKDADDAIASIKRVQHAQHDKAGHPFDPDYCPACGTAPKLDEHQI